MYISQGKKHPLGTKGNLARSLLMATLTHSYLLLPQETSDKKSVQKD